MRIFIVMCVNFLHVSVPFPVSNKRSYITFYSLILIISPSIIPNVSIAKWFVSFTDDCTHATWLFLLKHKYDVSTFLPNFYLKNCCLLSSCRIFSKRALKEHDYYSSILVTTWMGPREEHKQRSCRPSDFSHFIPFLHISRKRSSFH